MDKFMNGKLYIDSFIFAVSYNQSIFIRIYTD